MLSYLVVSNIVATFASARVSFNPPLIVEERPLLQARVIITRAFFV